MRRYWLVVAAGCLVTGVTVGCDGGPLPGGRPGEVTNGDSGADNNSSAGDGADAGTIVTPDGGSPDAAVASDSGAPDTGTTATDPDSGGGNNQLAVTVVAKDDGLAETNITKPRVVVRNTGTVALTGFEVRYYFTVTENLAPAIDVYYSPEAQLSLVQQTATRWYVSAAYQRQLDPGAETEAGAGLTYGLHFASWASWNKTDDESHAGLTGSMAATEHIDVFNTQHQRIYGTVGP
jgi:hypothetical protein